MFIHRNEHSHCDVSASPSSHNQSHTLVSISPREQRLEKESTSEISDNLFDSANYFRPLNINGSSRCMNSDKPASKTIPRLFNCVIIARVCRSAQRRCPHMILLIVVMQEKEENRSSNKHSVPHDCCMSSVGRLVIKSL